MADSLHEARWRRVREAARPCDTRCQRRVSPTPSGANRCVTSRSPAEEESRRDTNTPFYSPFTKKLRSDCRTLIPDEPSEGKRQGGGLEELSQPWSYYSHLLTHTSSE